ncbi:hypothetical protein JHD49_07320 [Sulfurimonas sp. SAG-AH-194-C21]|nr:hypothetical protein [Sulfurimonas sp. SAG-AH-194-C21]MDF1883741.1 hypothetical protein [Sulfurimonas sp. SAG-AH-194-C21]
MLNIAFFTEAGTNRGLGHLTRLYTISEAFKEHTVEFFLDSDLNYEHQFQNIISFSWENFFLQKKYDIIFIDSYEAPLEIYESIHNNATLAIYIDDYKRLTYPKGVIINFSPDAQQNFYPNINTQHSYLLGLKYTPIRSIFKKIKVQKEKQVFIMLGGTDTKDLTLVIAKYLQKKMLKIVVVTNNKQDVLELENLPNITVLFRPDDYTLVFEMSKSSHAIATASMSVYELAFTKTKTTIIAVSKNQIIGAKTYLRHSLVQHYVNIENEHYLEELFYTLKTDSLKLTPPVDAEGAQRIYHSVTRQFI